MHIIPQDIEHKLMKELRSIWQTQPEYRCLQLKLSLSKKYNDEWPDLISQKLVPFLEDSFWKTFVCHDHDIFVINRTITHKKVAQLLTRLRPELGLDKDEMAEIASLYEIGVNWPKLRIICEKKIEAIRLKKELEEHEKKLKIPENVSAQDAAEAITEANDEMAKTLADRRKKRKIAEIMVIEDDPLSQRLISNVLKGEYNFTILGEGANACTNYLIKAPDVLFLDINLPDANGHDILKQIFDIDPDAYVVMFSGNGDKENVLKAINLGAKGFLGKPFTRDKLMQYIQKSPHMENKWS